mmetsp:Transcript_67072/g.193859  ORF Transcript_67072/g.193859 Transcript_67072/m.193859 type:complete len:213 (+) Transcript_67072:1151-1789(+)
MLAGLTHRQCHRIDLLRDLMVFQVLLPLVQRADSAEDADRAFEVLDRVVQLLPSHLGVGKLGFRDAVRDGACDRVGQLVLGGAHGVYILHVRALRFLQGLGHGFHELLRRGLPRDRRLNLLDLGGVQVHRLRGLQRGFHLLDVVRLDGCEDLVARFRLGPFDFEDLLGLGDCALADAAALGEIDGDLQCRDIQRLHGISQRLLRLLLGLGAG